MPDLHLRIERDEDEAIASLPELSEDEILALMRRAAITDAKLIPWGSNYTFAVALDDDELGGRLGIYKPRRGESPLWDFETGTLYRREHAATRHRQPATLRRTESARGRDRRRGRGSRVLVGQAH
jgi:hypothetical protein